MKWGHLKHGEISNPNNPDDLCPFYEIFLANRKTDRLKNGVYRKVYPEYNSKSNVYCAYTLLKCWENLVKTAFNAGLHSTTLITGP